MTPQELKNSILQQAIQGRLVEQRPEEGTAEELYQQIQAEKQRLIKEKKIKKEKGNFGEVTTEEKLFEIPASWKWTRFGNIMINRDSERVPLSVSQRASLDKIYDYYGASGVIDRVDNYLFDKTLLLIGEDGANLLTRSTPIAYLATGKYWVNNHAHVLDCNENQICMKYIMYFINAISLAKYVTGTAQPKMNQEKMNSIPVSLPPLAEQKRIVAKIEELLPLIDRYEAAWSCLEAFNKRFPEDMQKSILQQAIQGKLVEQRPEEGTGEELYQQIQAEKQALIKAKKIKKDKPLPEITDDEKPFEIPESWKWVRLLDVVKIATNLVNPKLYEEYMHIAPDNIEKGTGKLLECHTVKEDKVNSSNHLFFKGQVIYSKIRPLLKKAVIAPFDGLCSADMYPLTTEIHSGFLLYFLLSSCYNEQVARTMSSRVKMPKLNQKEMSTIVIPLPPLAEQKRIVDRIEQLLPLCERLK